MYICNAPVFVEYVSFVSTIDTGRSLLLNSQQVGCVGWNCIPARYHCQANALTEVSWHTLSLSIDMRRVVVILHDSNESLLMTNVPHGTYKAVFCETIASCDLYIGGGVWSMRRCFIVSISSYHRFHSVSDSSCRVIPCSTKYLNYWPLK